MERKSQKPSSKHPAPERKSPNNLILYAVVLGTAILLLVGVLGMDSPAEIRYGELIALIEKGAVPRRRSTFNEGPKGKETTVRYSNLADVTVGPHEVSGKVSRQEIHPVLGQRKDNLAFHTDRLGLEDDKNYLFDLLKKHGFANVRGEAAPSMWRSWTQFVFMAGSSGW